MEKKIGSKEVKMKVATPAGETAGMEAGKLSYEELNKVCMELSQQNQQYRQYTENLLKQMREMDISNHFKRLDYLFKVVEISNYNNTQWSFDGDFVVACLKEIQDTMTLPVEESKGEETKEE